MRSRVLLVGADSFTGSYLLKELDAHGYDVVGTSHTGSEGLIALDLTRDAAAVAQVVASAAPDYIVNLAGISHVAHGNPADFYFANTAGVANLLVAIETAAVSVRKVLLVSTSNVYDPHSKPVLDETCPLHPSSHYGISKWAMERLALQWFSTLPLLVVRPFNYTGRGQVSSFLIPKLVEAHARRESVIRLGNTHVERDFSDVRNVVGAYRCLLEAPIERTVVNVCSGHGLRLHEVLGMLAELSGHRPQIVTDAALVRPNEPAALIGDRTRLQEAIGQVPRIPFEETLRWMLERP